MNSFNGIETTVLLKIPIEIIKKDVTQLHPLLSTFMSKVFEIQNQSEGLLDATLLSTKRSG